MDFSNYPSQYFLNYKAPPLPSPLRIMNVKMYALVKEISSSCPSKSWSSQKYSLHFNIHFNLLLYVNFNFADSDPALYVRRKPVLIFFSSSSHQLIDFILKRFDQFSKYCFYSARMCNHCKLITTKRFCFCFLFQFWLFHRYNANRNFKIKMS